MTNYERDNGELAVAYAMLTAEAHVMKRYALLIAALFASPAFGQPSTLTLQQALDYARQHQPSLIAARARVQVARAQALIPEAAKAFRVGAAAEILGGTNNNTTASYATLGFLDVARVGGTPANAPVSWSPYASTLAGISVHKELYDFGRIDLLSDAFGAQAQAANEAAQVSQLDIDLFVEESFYAVLGAKAVLAASEAAVTRSTTHRDFARARVNAQLMPPIELARAEADLARYQVDQVRAQGALATAQAVLAAAVGSSATEIDAGADDVALKEPGREALGDVESRSPEMRAARDQLEAQRLFTRSIEAEMRPDFGISAELTGRAGGATVTTNPSPAGSGFVPDVPNWDALVVFTWPLYDKVVSARANTSAQLEAVRAAELQQVSEAVRSQAERAFVELDVERQAQPALQRAVDAAAANHAQAEARFNGGLGTAVELSDAEALLTEAQIQIAVGQFQLSRARARLARVFAESIK